MKRSQRLIRIGPDITCIAERSLGATRARLVCGEDEEAIIALAPYMTRGLPTETLSAADLHARLLAKPFHQRYGSQVTLLKTAGVPFILREAALDHPKFDPALRDVLYGLADELVALFDDTDRLSLDLAIAEDQSSLRASMTLALTGKKSYVSQSLAKDAARAGAPPPSFWMLPSEATGAAYSVATDTSDFKEAAAALAALADGALDYLELGEAQRKPLVEAFERVLLKGEATAAAQLPGIPPASPGATTSESAKIAEAVRYELGYSLMAVEGEIAAYQDLFSAAVRALGDRKLRARLETLAELPKGGLPTVRERAPRGAKGLPRGTKVYEIVVPVDVLMEEPRKGPPLSVVVVTVPDAERSWIGVSADEAGLYEHLSASRTSPGTATLQNREGLASLRAVRASSGGFLTLASILGSLDSSLSRLRKGEAGPAVSPALRTLGMLPHRGETPMVWSLIPTAEGPQATAAIDVPREVVQDAAAAIAAGVGKSSRP